MVLRATLETGEQFVVDFTHNQWGWDECLYDWDTFVALRTSSVIDIAPIGQWCNTTCRARNIAPAPNSYDFGIMMLRKDVMKSVVEELEQSLSPYRDLESLLRLTTATLTSKCEDIRNEIEIAIQKKQAEHAYRGFGRIYFEEGEHFWKQGRADLWRTASWTHNVVVTPGGAARHRGIWFSKKDYDELQGNIVALKRAWAERMREAALELEVDFNTSVSFGSRFPL
ncbi:hypothetical protein BR93DRAFT_931216 [Coniochaeta sp. PMI_546]|nr:hypothetical protein BR93DRAFT_931216 [Coniochaeta sp. PMI_546]